MDVAPAYATGNPVLKDLWVDPAAGDDAASGRSRAEALRTLGAAWARIPREGCAHGWRVLCAPGVHLPPDNGQWLFDDRAYAPERPIVFQSEKGAASLELPQVLFLRCRGIQVLDLTFKATGNKQVIPSDNIVLHFVYSQDVLVRGVTAVGLEGPNGLPLLTVKANQCQRVYVEDCDFSGAGGNALNFGAVHYGHVVRSRFHKTGAECMYVKGGSAHHLIAGNEMFDGKNHGVLAGQGTGFQYMIPPWLHYEAYDVKIVNNVVHDAGSGIATTGGYNILLAWNTCYRVGTSRDTIVIGMGGHGWFGERPKIVDEYFALGGWCTPEGTELYNIPCKNVTVCNNVIYNPDGFESRHAHIGLSGPVKNPPGCNLPEYSRADDGLVLRGNAIWNGAKDKPLLDDVENMYHLAARPTADAAAILRENAVNTLRPELIDPERGDFRPVPGGSLIRLAPTEIADFPGGDAPTRPPVPAGTLDNAVPLDRAGRPRAQNNCIGAYAF
ncbi:MAG: right-handed parallel beta-helix repeat-containing protein [Planctomycetota bacterium]|nr:right-handed parallel beta-helix repeat-containing protein [Planctomycetota bacterium]